MSLFSLIKASRDRALAQRRLEEAATQAALDAAKAAVTTVQTSIVPQDTEVTAVASTTIPQQQYTKTRREIKTFRIDPLRAGGSPAQPASQTVPGPRISLNVTDTGVRYNWTGFFAFDNAEYEFVINATNRFRVKLDGVTIIDDFNSGPTRTRNKSVPVTAGNHQVSIEWRPNGANSIEFNFTREFKTSWVSCQDGATREGDPPETWIKTASGCFKPPLTDDEDVAVGVDLLDVIDISPDSDARIERAYIKGSGTALSPHRLKFLNRSTNMTLGVRLNGPKPVRFVTARGVVGDVGVGGLPANSFELGTRQEKLVDVVFIPSELDPLPEGLIRSDVLVSVSAGTLSISKDGDDNIDIGTPIPDGDILDLPVDRPLPPPPPPAPSPTWRDCSGRSEVERDGFPPSDWTLRADGCYVPPVVVPPTVSFTISSVEFPPLRDNEGTPIGRANVRPTISAGRSSWNWQWNFDVNRQGPGTGNPNAQDPVISWRMNANDFRNLQNNGRTTRVVEAIATRRGGSAAGQIVRARHTVVLDDAGLVIFQRSEEDIGEFGGEFNEGDFE